MADGKGHLVIIGGAEDREDAKVVLSTVAELAGGEDGRVVVLTTASRRAGERPEAKVEVVGSGAVTVLDARDVLYTNSHKVDRGDILALSDVHLHLLPAGFRHEPGENGDLDRLIRRLGGVA